MNEMHLEKYILISKEGEEAALCIGQTSDPLPPRKATVDIIICLFQLPSNLSNHFTAKVVSIPT